MVPILPTLTPPTNLLSSSPARQRISSALPSVIAARAWNKQFPPPAVCTRFKCSPFKTSSPLHNKWSLRRDFTRNFLNGSAFSVYLSASSIMTPASRGSTFSTSDGFTVEVERIYLALIFFVIISVVFPVLFRYTPFEVHSITPTSVFILTHAAYVVFPLLSSKIQPPGFSECVILDIFFLSPTII